LILSAQPAERLPVAGFRGSDKLVHALLYAGLGALTGRALLGGDRAPPGVPRPVILIAAAALVGFGILDEWTQSFTPGRTSSAADVLADAIGACTGLFVASRYHWRRHGTHPQLRR
jgi:VanZ family protein